MRQTKALLRAMGKVIQRAEPLGENDLVDVLLFYKVIIARQAVLDRERGKARARTRRRARSRPPVSDNAKKDRSPFRIHLVKPKE
jgi:hypothetical protein